VEKSKLSLGRDGTFPGLAFTKDTLAPLLVLDTLSLLAILPDQIHSLFNTHLPTPLSSFRREHGAVDKTTVLSVRSCKCKPGGRRSEDAYTGVEIDAGAIQ
jgi:hypothetical protein